MKLEFTSGQMMALLEYALNSREFRSAKKVVDIQASPGLTTVYTVTLEEDKEKQSALSTHYREGEMNEARSAESIYSSMKDAQADIISALRKYSEE